MLVGLERVVYIKQYAAHFAEAETFAAVDDRAVGFQHDIAVFAIGLERRIIDY